MASARAPARSGLLPRDHALAKLEGKIFFSDTDIPFNYFMERTTITVGRSDPVTVFQDPLIAAQEGIDVGLGDSNKLSRKHARIEYVSNNETFLLTCLGKNGLTVTDPDTLETIIMTPTTNPLLLRSRTLIQMGDCVFVFLRPTAFPVTKKKRREWIKAEYVALRTLMMRLGYGRWETIVKNTNGRLSERDPEELIPVARRFVARCFIHARQGVEQKALAEILREDTPDGSTEEEAKADIDALVEDAKQEAEPGEKRKFVRWARKLRLLRRLRDVHDHSSLDRLRVGELRVFTPPPAKFWTCADDADLILGTYRHGYGATEAIRCDPTLGFHSRFSPQLAFTKKGAADKAMKARASMGGNDEDEDHDDDHDDDDDDDEENEMNGEGNSKKPKKEEQTVDGEPNNSDSGKSSGSPKREAKTEETPVKEEGSEIQPEGDAKRPRSPRTSMVDDEDGDKIVPEPPVERKRFGNGPRRKSSAEGINTDKAAAEAWSEAAKETEDGLVPFPPSESLMRRLKSIIHSCAKEFERDQRELRKISQAQYRAQRRRDDLAARKAEKQADKARLREERRVAKSQPFSKKDAAEFERALCNFGLVYREDNTTVDWKAFVDNVPSFQTKYFSTLDEALVELHRESNRVIDVEAAQDDQDAEQVLILEGKTPSTVFTTLTADRALRMRERLLFFRTLRSEVLNFPELGPILRGMKRTKELPIWWRSFHDRALLQGVHYHGLNNWDAVVKDPNLAFSKSMAQYNRKYASDPKALKRGVFPKANCLVKRSQALVVYFRSKASDPVYLQLARDSVAGDGESSQGRRDDMGSGPTPDKDDLDDDQEAGNGAHARSRGSSMSIDHGGRSGDWSEEISLVIPAAKPKAGPIVKRETILDIVDDEGEINLPASLGSDLWLVKLGKIVPLPAFHTDKTLFPVGYQAVRKIGGLYGKHYLCEIGQDADGANPVFKVALIGGFNPSNVPPYVWERSKTISEGTSIRSVWLKAVNEMQTTGGGVDLASGPERFGLYEPTVIHHMQKLEGAKQCEKFLFRDFTAQGAGAVVAPPVGILEAMTDALVLTKKRGAEEEEPEEMEIPGEWASSFGGKRKRRKNSSYWQG